MSYFLLEMPISSSRVLGDPKAWQRKQAATSMPQETRKQGLDIGGTSPEKPGQWFESRTHSPHIAAHIQFHKAYS